MIRKLNRTENGRTRALWEEIFAEDSRKFLDYYYTEVTGQNEIYVIEDVKEKMGIRAAEIQMAASEPNALTEIQAMLQLNPYKLRAGAYKGIVNYIVGVATKETYRGQGYMARLLKTSCQEMYRKKQPFTFLMPAVEAIYYPHAFRFIYSQSRGDIIAENTISGLVCQKASEDDCTEIAAFARKMVQKYDVCAEREVSYYRRMLKEQISENGGILMLRTDGKLKGVLYYASEGEYFQIREPLIETDDSEKVAWISQAAYIITQKKGTKVHCEGFGTEEKRVIMARVIHLPVFLSCFTAQTDVDGRVRIEDTMLEENTGIWRISARQGQRLRAEKIGVRDNTKEAEKMEEMPVPVSALISCLSGHTNIEDMEQNEQIVLAEAAKQLLKSIRPWENVFLNEIV